MQYRWWRIWLSSTACDDLTDRICSVPAWRVRAIDLLGVSTSEVSPDELDGLCGSLCEVIPAEPQLFLAFRDFRGLNMIGDRSKGWIRA